MRVVFTLLACCAVMLGGQASAAFLSVAGNGLEIAAPSSVTNATVTNQIQWGFVEKSNVLVSDLKMDGPTSNLVGNAVTYTGFVNSHMIFLNNPDRTNPDALTTNATWTFKEKIIGVLSDVGGTLEAASTALLGLGTTTYEAPFTNRGLEGNDVVSSTYSGSGNGDDTYRISGSILYLRMRVTQPGDWIRVLTEGPGPSNAVPEPATMALFGMGALGMSFASRLRRRR